ncbi:dihydrodipicolinate synthase family protein [Paracoccus aestuariivivens]|uniref:Dihydrodipicolinate synthase family protein n=1 Tax=Paracoccus aestuariivivens TaxID=1820333 RepID=A0A6L6JGF8_9RHOB|nr:dihydrodipicolinate synthase family protein [Paracoccus aestuariivivens]MTH80288.1 dihydrodipicolinate synthase family protein [Paracoccus aestuariivivens]
MTKSSLKNCTGLHVVAQTPFRADGALDLDSIDTLSAFYYGHGARGLTVLGVSGEQGKLTPDECIATAARFIAAANGHRIIVGVSSPGLAQLVTVTHQVMAEGADAVMICPPRGTQTDDDLMRYFDEVFACIGDTPTVLQDFPVHSGVKMSPTLIRRLVEAFPQIGVIKEEDLPSITKITRLREELGTSVRILTGNNGLYLPQELARGADGPMAGFSFPEMLSGVDDLMRNGDREGAHDLFDRYLPLLRYEAQGEWGIAIRKEVMRQRGAMECAALRAPGPVLTALDRAEIRSMIDRMGLEFKFDNKSAA